MAVRECTCICPVRIGRLLGRWSSPWVGSGCSFRWQGDGLHVEGAAAAVALPVVQRMDAHRRRRCPEMPVGPQGSERHVPRPAFRILHHSSSQAHNVRAPTASAWREVPLDGARVLQHPARLVRRGIAPIDGSAMLPRPVGSRSTARVSVRTRAKLGEPADDPGVCGRPSLALRSLTHARSTDSSGPGTARRPGGKCSDETRMAA